MGGTLPEITPRERDVLVTLCRPAASSELFVEPASVREIAASLAVHLLDLCISLPQAALGWLVLTLRRPAPVDEQPAAVDAQRR